MPSGSHHSSPRKRDRLRDRDSKRASKKPDKRLARLYRKMPVTAKGQATPLNEVKKRKRGNHKHHHDAAERYTTRGEYTAFVC